MQTAATNASTVPPSSHCSAGCQDFIVWLRIIGSGLLGPALRR
jgi:hypothetical protein